jgi:hypothetical protein
MPNSSHSLKALALGSSLFSTEHIVPSRRKGGPFPDTWYQQSADGKVWSAHILRKVEGAVQTASHAEFLNRALTKLPVGSQLSVGLHSGPFRNEVLSAWADQACALQPKLAALAEAQQRWWASRTHEEGGFRSREQYVWVAVPVAEQEVQGPDAIHGLAKLLTGIFGAHAGFHLFEPGEREGHALRAQLEVPHLSEGEVWAFRSPYLQKAPFVSYLSQAIADAEHAVKGSYWLWATLSCLTSEEQQRARHYAQVRAASFFASKDEHARHALLQKGFQEGEGVVKLAWTLHVPASATQSDDRQVLTREVRRQGYATERVAGRFIPSIASSQRTKLLEKFGTYLAAHNVVEHMPLKLNPSCSSFAVGGLLLKSDSGTPSVFDAFEGYHDNNVLAIGQPGSGKSYFLKGLTVSILRRGGVAWAIPPHVNLCAMLDVAGGVEVKLGAGCQGGLNLFAWLTDSEDATLAVSWVFRLMGYEDDWETPSGLRVFLYQQIGSLWVLHGRQLRLQHVFDAIQDRGGEWAHQAERLRPYVEEGAYAELFDGVLTDEVLNAPFVWFSFEDNVPALVRSHVTQTIHDIALLVWGQQRLPTQRKALYFDTESFAAGCSLRALELSLRRGRMLNVAALVSVADCELLGAGDSQPTEILQALLNYSSNVAVMRVRAPYVSVVAEHVLGEPDFPRVYQRVVSSGVGGFALYSSLGRLGVYRIEADPVSHLVLDEHINAEARYREQKNTGEGPLHV